MSAWLRQRIPVLLRRRSFFSLPDPFTFLPGANQPPEIQKYSEQKVLPYTTRQLYAVVADVENYPRFVPFCVGSRILERFQQENTATCMEAELTVGFLAFKESYVSHVTCRPFESVEAVASSSTPLFKTLETKWQFRPISPPTDSSQSRADQFTPTHKPIAPKVANPSAMVTLDLTYAFASPLYASVSAAFFSQVSTMMVKAFEDECLRAYGSPFTVCQK